MNLTTRFTTNPLKIVIRPLALAAGAWVLSCLAPAGASAQTYKVIHEFTAAEGRNWVSPLLLSGATLYGAVSGGGSDYGRVFRINGDGTGFTVLKEFTNWSDGAHPSGSLALSGGVLYGATYGGGNGTINGGGGVVFRMNTDGSGYTVLKRFDQPGGGPTGGVLLSGSCLYGTTLSGGWSPPGSIGWGTVFRLNTDGTGFTEIKQWNFADGPYSFMPECGLAQSGTILYGTTSQGGTYGYGVIFKINLDGTGYAVVRNMCCDGPFGVMVSSNSVYGTTGNMNGPGTVFRVNTDGGGFTTLKQFNTGEEHTPLGGLVLCGNTLYGTADAGGISNNGAVFRIDTNGYAVVKYFLGNDGSIPTAGLTPSGSTLYGITSYGGPADCGVLFALGYPPTAQISPPAQTAETGCPVVFQTQAETDASSRFQWRFNGTNLLDCTYSSLELTNLRLAQAGAYAVFITNLFGAVTSAPAMLSVIPPVDRRIVPAVRLTGGAGTLPHLEYADSLAASQWSSLSNLTLTGGTALCLDLSPALPAQRFYRAWQTSGPKPVLNATMATEIPLTGAIGSSVRVDYINAIGPTDAWVTLDTVLLTNPPQLYYDLTAFRQPARLYRLVTLP